MDSGPFDSSRRAGEPGRALSDFLAGVEENSGVDLRPARTGPVRRLGAVAAALALLAGGCGRVVPAAGPAPNLPAPASPAASSAAPAYSKIMIIAEENHDYGQVIGDRSAPYLNALAATYGSVPRMDAGYPERCPSLAAYILLTSGTTAGICDDKSPAAHPLGGDNIFHQVTAAGRTWRAYAESTPGPCALTNHDRYLVRHVPATYYLDVRADCARSTVALGTLTRGALRADVTAGTLPSYAFVTPDACDDMHGGNGCPSHLVESGDHWLRTWMTQILAGPDYRAGRLVVMITWDEGTGSSNHIPAIVVSPTTAHVAAPGSYTHCSTLRTAEEVLRLPLLGCAAGAASMTDVFHLR